MAEQTERKFGYMIPPHDCNCGQPPHGCATHHEVSMADWMHYINSYIDTRARQIYDKLKGQIGTGGGQGDTVVVTPSLESGYEIADIKVNGKTKTLYSPVPPDPTTVEVESTISTEDSQPIANIKVNGIDNNIYAPIPTQVSYSDSDDMPEQTIDVGTLTVNNNTTSVRIPDPAYTIFDGIILQDADGSGRLYTLYIKDGELKSCLYGETEPDTEEPEQEQEPEQE